MSYENLLRAIDVELNNLFLDPNNPRFWTEHSKETPEKRIIDTKIQQETAERIEQFGIEELYYSMLRNGFLYLDRIVVRRIQDLEDKYVVVEGNRRLAALKKLYKRIDRSEINEDGIDEERLQELSINISKIQVLLYTGTEGEDIAWMLQGIRHISGIRVWEPAQRARLVVKQVDEANMDFGPVGQRFGLTARAVGRLYRAYKGLEQMREDSDYGNKYDNKYFTLFDEAHKNIAVRKWLGWNDNRSSYENTDNLHQFYSWIIPDEDHENKRRIGDPRHVSILSELIEKKRDDLIGQIDRYQISIEEAKGIMAGSTGPYDWQGEIKKAKQIVASIPLSVFLEDSEELKKALNELQSYVNKALGSFPKSDL